MLVVFVVVVVDDDAMLMLMLLCFCLFLGRAQGELDVVRHRLETLSREKEDVTVGASAKIEELEAKVLEGELQRRKMHNLIQVGDGVGMEGEYRYGGASVVCSTRGDELEAGGVGVWGGAPVVLYVWSDVKRGDGGIGGG